MSQTIPWGGIDKELFFNFPCKLKILHKCSLDLNLFLTIYRRAPSFLQARSQARVILAPCRHGDGYVLASLFVWHPYVYVNVVYNWFFQKVICRMHNIFAIVTIVPNQLLICMFQHQQHVYWSIKYWSVLVIRVWLYSASRSARSLMCIVDKGGGRGHKEKMEHVYQRIPILNLLIPALEFIFATCHSSVHWTG